jgi:hypothetical protein
MIRLRSPLQETRLGLWMGASLIASVGGIALAWWFDASCHGGRGGAVAVAIAFGAYFTSRPVPEDLIEALDVKGKARFDDKSLECRVGRLRSALAIMLDRQRLEAFYLAVASITGTMVWGFGDWIAAAWLGADPCA